MSDPKRWECGNCGHAFYDGDGWTEWYCSQCGEEMHQTAPEGYTSNEELRELVAEWRDRGVIEPYGMTWLPPAKELEELINDG